jgi:hypothetical protein
MSEEELLERIKLLEEKIEEQGRFIRSVEQWLMLMVNGTEKGSK